MSKKITVCHVPFRQDFPPMGGVREHMVQLVDQLIVHPEVSLTTDFNASKLVHVQTAWSPPPTGRIDVWTCHGGFVPPIAQVQHNLEACRKIITVAKWVAEKYFPKYLDKTVVIPNGINLKDWDDLPPSGLEPGYWLWGQHQLRNDWHHFLELAKAFPEERFVSVLTAHEEMDLANLHTIGVQPREKFRSIINDCAVYVSTGSEVCPTMVLEAWACNKPVLAWNAHGNKELMLSDHARWPGTAGGALYNDVDEMLVAARHLLETVVPGKVDLTCRRIIEEQYQWKDIARRTIDVYKSLL